MTFQCEAASSWRLDQLIIGHLRGMVYEQAARTDITLLIL